MSYREATAALALIGLIASAAPSFAMTGIGCPDLPEYDRALGTIENGPGSCGMTTEQANRILGRANADAAAGQPAAPVVRRTHVHRKHHRKVTPDR